MSGDVRYRARLEPLPEYMHRVKHYPATANCPAFSDVFLAADLSMTVRDAGEAQEFEMAFAAIRRYLSDDPSPAHQGEIVNPTTGELEKLPAVTE